MRPALCRWCMKPFWVFVLKPKGAWCVWMRRHGPRQNVDICRARNENRLLIPRLSEYCRFELTRLGLATDSVHQCLFHPGSPKRKKIISHIVSRSGSKNVKADLSCNARNSPGPGQPVLALCFLPNQQALILPVHLINTHCQIWFAVGLELRKDGAGGVQCVLRRHRSLNP